MRNTQKTPSKASYDAGRKLTTDNGKRISDFTMKCFFYDSNVDTETGEMKQKQWLYRGWYYKRQRAQIGQIYRTELDCLLAIFNEIQMKCERVLIYDNRKAGFDIDEAPLSEIFHVSRGIVKRNRIKNNPEYAIAIPVFSILKHAA